MAAEIDVYPLETVPGASPGVSGVDLMKYLPVLVKLVEAFSTGTGSFTTWTPGGTVRVTIERV